MVLTMCIKIKITVYVCYNNTVTINNNDWNRDNSDEINCKWYSPNGVSSAFL